MKEFFIAIFLFCFIKLIIFKNHATTILYIILISYSLLSVTFYQFENVVMYI